MCVFVFVNLLPISCHPLTIFTCPCHWSASLPGIRLMTVAGSANGPPLLHLPCSTVWSLIRKRWITGEKSSQLKMKDTQYTWRIMNIKNDLSWGNRRGQQCIGESEAVSLLQMLVRWGAPVAVAKKSSWADMSLQRGCPAQLAVWEPSKKSWMIPTNLMVDRWSSFYQWNPIKICQRKFRGRNFRVTDF